MLTISSGKQDGSVFSLKAHMLTLLRLHFLLLLGFAILLFGNKKVFKVPINNHWLWGRKQEGKGKKGTFTENLLPARHYSRRFISSILPYPDSLSRSRFCPPHFRAETLRESNLPKGTQLVSKWTGTHTQVCLITKLLRLHKRETC